ncbi:hypothetical protein [Rhodanobacter terrae]|uniref:Uncharacterized protein n=1 Tax=Rhodanobacter terrae TaxID=418647 RepID=A0ABW0SVB5_9GAMM
MTAVDTAALPALDWRRMPLQGRIPINVGARLRAMLPAQSTPTHRAQARSYTGTP